MALLRGLWLACAVTVVTVVLGLLSFGCSVGRRGVVRQAQIARLWSRCMFFLARVRLEPEGIENVRSAVVALGIILSIILFGWAGFTVSLFDRTGSKQMRIARAWARCLLLLAGVELEIEGREKVGWNATFVICANHSSVLDIPVLLCGLPGPFRFLAHGELFHIPLLGTHLARAGHVPVPRTSGRSAVLGRALRIIEQQNSLMIFPEGHLSRDGVLDDFRDGAAVIAIKARVPLLPLALIGTYNIAPPGVLSFQRGRVRLCIGDPIPTEGLPVFAHEEITAAARGQIAQMLSRRAGQLDLSEDRQWFGVEEPAGAEQAGSSCANSR